MTLKLEVRGQSFKIDLVSNWVRKKYLEMVEVSGSIQERSAELSDIIGQLGKVESAEQLETLKESSVGIRDDIQKLVDEVGEIRDGMLSELLDSNDMKYDREWWEKKTSPEDINDFLLTCLNKDFKPGKDSSVKKN